MASAPIVILKCEARLEGQGPPCLPQNAPSITAATPQSGFILEERVLEYNRLKFTLRARAKFLVSNRNVRPAVGALPSPTFVPSANVLLRLLRLACRRIDGWRRLKLDTDEQCILLGVLRSKSVKVARTIAVRRFERRKTRVEEENFFVGIGDECRVFWKRNGPWRYCIHGLLQPAATTLWVR